MTKIFESSSKEELERMVNDFELKNKVFAGQSHVTVVDGKLVYTIFVMHWGPRDK